MTPTPTPAPRDAGELKACPFCGSTKITSDQSGDSEYDVTCWECKAGTIACGPSEADRQGAIVAWNTRTPAPREIAEGQREAIATEIERYGEGLVPELRIVCAWLATHFRRDLALAHPVPDAGTQGEDYARGIEDAAKCAENLCADMTVEANAERDGLTSSLHRASAQTAGKIATAVRALVSSAQADRGEG